MCYLCTYFLWDLLPWLVGDSTTLWWRRMRQGSISIHGWMAGWSAGSIDFQSMSTGLFQLILDTLTLVEKLSLYQT